MTKIKFCGLTRICDTEAVNELKPEFIGFVFAEKSKRFITADKASELKRRLSPCIKAVGVFVNERAENVARLLAQNVIDIAQLHGDENDEYIKELRRLTDKPIIRAFRIKSEQDIAAAQKSAADFILLDSGAGGGERFDWSLIKNVKRPYFLAGGLTAENAGLAVEQLQPYAVDTSSGIETDGLKDKNKMSAFVAAVRKDRLI